MRDDDFFLPFWKGVKEGIYESVLWSPILLHIMGKI